MATLRTTHVSYDQKKQMQASLVGAAFRVGVKHPDLDFADKQHQQYLRNEIYKNISPGIIIQSRSAEPENQVKFERLVEELTNNAFKYLPMEDLVKHATAGQKLQVQRNEIVSSHMAEVSEGKKVESFNLKTFFKKVIDLPNEIQRGGEEMIEAMKVSFNEYKVKREVMVSAVEKMLPDANALSSVITQKDFNKQNKIGQPLNEQMTMEKAEKVYTDLAVNKGNGRTSLEVLEAPEIKKDSPGLTL